MKNIRLAVLLAAAALSASPAQAKEPYRFGVIPQVSMDKLAAAWVPILEAVSKKSGVPLKFDSAPNLNEYEARYMAGDYDMAFVQPYFYAVLDKKKHYRAHAREDGSLQGIFIVAKDSPLKTLADLRGKRVAFPSPNSFAATLLTKQDLRKAGVDPEKGISAQYMGSQDAVYEALLSGGADCGAGIPRTLDQLPEERRSLLRVLHKTAPSVGFAVSALGKMPSEDAAKVAAALIELSTEEQGKALLKAANVKGFVPAKDADWDGLRKAFK